MMLLNTVTKTINTINVKRNIQGDSKVHAKNLKKGRGDQY